MELFKKKNNKSKKSDKEVEAKGINVLDVDLIKDEVKKKLNWSKYITLMLISVLVSGILAYEVYWLISWWEKQEIEQAKEIDQQIEMIREEIVDLENEYASFTSLKERADLTYDLLNNHPYFTNFFRWLERMTLSSVTWNSFNGDLDGRYSLDGKANTFADISWQVKAFLDSEAVISASVDSASGGIGSETIILEGTEDAEGNPETEVVYFSETAFTLNLEIDPIIFYLQ